MSNIDNDPWDDLPQGEFVKWEKVGDNIAGTIAGKALRDDVNGNPCPHLVIRTPDGTERQLTAAQANLKAQLMSLKPKVGDKIAITYSGDEKAAKGTKKLFTIQHQSADPVAAEGPKKW